MAEVITMPKMTDDMEDALLTHWFVQEGDQVHSGDILAEVETDKATMELESYRDGIILHIAAQKGDRVPLNGLIAIIGQEGEDVSELLKKYPLGNIIKKDTLELEKDFTPSRNALVFDTEKGLSECVVMPSFGDDDSLARVTKWFKKVGDRVKVGDVLAEVESDKALMELEAYADGILLHVVQVEQEVPVNGLLAIIGDEQTDVRAILEKFETIAPTDLPPAPTVESKSKLAEPKVESLDLDLPCVMTLPNMGGGMKSAKVTKWHVNVGDQIDAGNILADVETTKATMALESYEAGTVLYLAPAHTKIYVDGLIAIIGDDSVDVKKVIQQFRTPSSVDLGLDIDLEHKKGCLFFLSKWFSK